MYIKKIFIVLICGFTLLGPALKTYAAKGHKMSLEEQQAVGLISTGLKPLYPIQDSCLEVSSPFASLTRYDGSQRTPFSNHGYHGGMDISLKIGTPIIAVADGVVVQVATGGRLVGNMIMLRHAPQDTGFDLWTFSKYQHLDKPSMLEIGAHIKKGDIVGFGGKTGTTGGHFGTAGYAHLHINIYANSTGKYKQGKGVKLNIRDKMYVDPLAIFLKITLNSHELRKMPQLQKTFLIPYMTTTGKFFPKNTRTVWPIPCNPENK